MCEATRGPHNAVCGDRSDRPNVTNCRLDSQNVHRTMLIDIKDMAAVWRPSAEVFAPTQTGNRTWLKLLRN
jgi:hypothetical protein